MEPVKEKLSTPEKPVSPRDKTQKTVLILGGVLVVSLIISLFVGGGHKPSKIASMNGAGSVNTTYDNSHGFADQVNWNLDETANQNASNNSSSPSDNRMHSEPSEWREKETQRVLESRTSDFGFEAKMVVNASNNIPTSTSIDNTSPLPLTSQQIDRLKNYFEKNKSASVRTGNDDLMGEDNHSHFSNSANQEKLLIPTGTVIRGALDQEIQSDYTGAWQGEITQDVYSLDDQFILFPKGSKLFGQSFHTENINEPIQNRLKLSVEWVILPNGKRIDFQKQTVADRAGVGAIGDRVDRHLGWQLLGVVAYAALSASLPRDSATAYGYTQPTFKGQLSDGFREQAAPMANKYLGLTPTVKLSIGTPITIRVQEDIYMEPWSRV